MKMDGEAEDFCAYGDALMYAGVKLKQAFGGTGYNEQIRPFPRLCIQDVLYGADERLTE